MSRTLYVRDPDALRRFSVTVIALAILWPMMQLAQFDVFALFEVSNLKVFGNFLIQFFPPNLQSSFLALVLKATVETLAMATAGIALAMLMAVPLGLIITYSLSISRIGPASGHRIARLGRYLARMLMLLLRGIPEIVWALLLVRVFGLGPIAGVLAIAITYGGMLAKVYSEILETENTLPARALLMLGSGRINAFLYGLLPGASQELASYTIYRWECAVRASVVMGFVGAGGLGQLMDQSMKMLNGGEVSTILIVFLLLVLLADYISLIIRRQLA
ncbi:PhnE/PtxC family ABC transporter permease [Polynucleobacter sphagniphilus]|uniref:PhnE/PtxC family ABC transporter permease n=1 Tax=Polynucleobacter sphagniphilus TaxID=1743169 RepID=UPI00096BBF9D|nr:ABC transporter permease [Polynucleobacter sphagniphilus]MDF9789258.1 phosphonate transport system permease protein [Polynucleobacter sphagniphilus]MDH6154480.1 phosphonate transport system permease protein [Polynucleobacter sphagniphilus]MDH6241545.1 phosphonate transport system permease protein [Polynucleobacter sphagniphilus]MDH6249401.1 phosphonate transport system permease protein [Polynucleobacter sphagniphilus]MDH6300942.1 phosphonate transport system permease protein [Polynucleobact